MKSSPQLIADILQPHRLVEARALRPLPLRLRPVGPAPHIVVLLEGKEYRIFPLFPFGSDMAGRWIDYDDQSPAGIAYRLNAERFNKSSFTPSRWRVDKIEIDSDSTSAYIQTSAFGISVTTNLLCSTCKKRIFAVYTTIIGIFFTCS